MSNRRFVNGALPLFLVLAILVSCSSPQQPSPGPSTPPNPVPTANHSPTARNLAVVVQQKSSASLNLKSLATDPDGDPLTFSIKSEPKHGQAHLNQSELTFMPAADYLGLTNSSSE